MPAIHILMSSKPWWSLSGLFRDEICPAFPTGLLQRSIQARPTVGHCYYVIVSCDAQNCFARERRMLRSPTMSAKSQWGWVGNRMCNQEKSASDPCPSLQVPLTYRFISRGSKVKKTSLRTKNVITILLPPIVFVLHAGTRRADATLNTTQNSFILSQSLPIHST